MNLIEIERTRTRERDAPKASSYELALKQDRERGERQMTGRIVVRMADCPQILTRQGYLRSYLGLTTLDMPLQDWIVFTHEVRTASGKHRHQGGLVIYVIEGRGYSVVDGERVDWEKGDLVLLPLRQRGVEHQHFNVDPEHPALWMAFIHSPTREYVASEMTQSEVSPEFRKSEG